ncbi:carboxymethylenebutenolidase [candidate division WOR-1 bacterium DG_54_3]|uniref:Carboxymethylenebutenolidase n=1 Tax=candidate division WOR-1 bacterium DG_54_3 TaxID=1703775 RepID=A0A0S7Y600_UNCSA|nr:MAG: carboxymethylenebutenolidase [candidate division WOR-1 bacterium DG_54_3]
MDQKIIDLYDEYSKGSLDRREFLKRLAVLTGGTVAAVTLLPLIEKKQALAEFVPPDDLRLYVADITYPGETGDIRAHYARPKGEEKLPGVIVIHENRGLNPHTKDVARRVALEGFLAVAPDALSPLGGTPEDVDEARSRMRELGSEATVKNFVAAVEYLKTHPQSTGKVGCMGFCWGGGVTTQVAVHSPDLKAAVPFYGRQPASEDVPKIKASLLLHYAGLDERINEGIEAFEAALKQASVEYKIYIYEGAEHAFFNDTNASRYHEEASQLAWKRTIEFFNKKLKT